MAGMFDMFNTDDPARASEMALIAGLLGGKGSFNSILGRSMMGAQEAGQSAKQRQQAAKLNQLQLEDIQRKAARQAREDEMAALPRQFMRPPSMPGMDATGGMDTALENPNNAASGGGFDMQGYLGALRGKDPAQAMAMELQALQLQALTKKQKPMPVKLNTNERLLDPETNQVLVDAAPEKPEKAPEEIRVLRMIYGDGTPAYQQALSRLGTKKTTLPREPSAAAPDAGIDLGDAAIENAAARYNTDGTLPPNLGRGTQGSKLTAKILDRAALMAATDGDDAKAQRIRQIANKATSGALLQLSKQEASVGAFERNFTRNADIALELSKTTDKTGVPLANKWINVGKRAVTGDPALSAYDAALKTVVNEYTKILSGAMGNTQMAEGEVKKVENLLNAAQTAEQVQSVIALMKRETANRMIGFQEQKAEMNRSMIPDRQKPAAPVQTATNPATGEKLMLKDGKWVPLK